MTQIEVVDDSDRAEEIISAIAGFPQLKINYFKQPSRVSISENFNTCVERAQNDLVHILHDDDYVLPGFYATYGEYARRYPDVGLIAGRARVVSSDGSGLKELPHSTRSLRSPRPTRNHSTTMRIFKIQRLL